MNSDAAKKKHLHWILVLEVFYWSTLSGDISLTFHHLPSNNATLSPLARKDWVSASGGWRPPVRATRNQPPQAIQNNSHLDFSVFLLLAKLVKNHSIYNFKHIFYDSTRYSTILLTSNSSLEISKSSWYHQHSPHNSSQNEFPPGPAPFPLQFLEFLHDAKLLAN